MTTTKITALKRNFPTRDTITGVAGQITHLNIAPDFVFYFFQPAGLHPKYRNPVSVEQLLRHRFPADHPTEELDIPMGIIHTEAEDEITGFKGIVTSFVLHPGNCLHAVVQPPGKNPETGEFWDKKEFDIRRLKGPAIEPMTEEAIRADEKVKPSPSAITSNFI